MRTSFLLVFVSIALIACGKDGVAGEAAAAKQKQDPPFAVTVTKVEHAETLAPNKTYAEQGLGAKAADGKTFACVFYRITASKDTLVPVAWLVDGAGKRTQPSSTAAGKRPTEWQHDVIHGKLTAGQAANQISCFELAKPGAAGMKLLFEDTGWGPKNPPWELAIALP
jgi:hypothetical protein